MLPRSRAAILCAVLAVSSVHAQTPITPTPTAPTAPDVPKAPALSEVLELKRQNLVLRVNLLQSQREAIQLQMQRESQAIDTAYATLRTEVEAAHAGWTIGDDGAVTPKPPPAVKK